MPVDYFGESVAQRYDADSAEMFEPDVVTATVDFLAELAGAGPALEFGIGTGRIALPLRQRGVPVSGIDLSEAMLTRLRAKPGGEDVEAVVGDFSEEQVPGTFSLVYLIFNTIMNVTSQDGQVACFCNAARHLVDRGWFVVEVSVPDLQRLPSGETIRPFTVTPERLGFDEYDVVGQGLVSHHYAIDGDRVRTMSVPFRYVWPAELDLMARLAEMTLRRRCADWRGSPFIATSTSHVSVWQKVANSADR